MNDVITFETSIVQTQRDRVLKGPLQQRITITAHHRDVQGEMRVSYGLVAVEVEFQGEFVAES